MVAFSEGIIYALYNVDYDLIDAQKHLKNLKKNFWLKNFVSFWVENGDKIGITSIIN
jgi:hypothetical protein